MDTVDINKTDTTNEQKKIIKSTIIAPDTVIDSSISSYGNVEIYGTVMGKISAGGDISIYADAVSGPVHSDALVFVAGCTTGDISADNVVVAGGLYGNVFCEGGITIEESGVVVGDITAQSANIYGAVKGNINVKEEIFLKPTAIIKGSMASTSITVEAGASIDGANIKAYVKEITDDYFTPNNDTDRQSKESMSSEAANPTLGIYGEHKNE